MLKAKVEKDGTLSITGIQYDSVGKKSSSGKSMLKCSGTEKVSLDDKVHTVQLNVFELITDGD